MRRLHAGNGVHIEMDDACLDLFDQAPKETGIAPAAAARLSAYFRSATQAQREWASDTAEVPDELPFRYV